MRTIIGFIFCCSLILASGTWASSNSESSITISSKDPKITETDPLLNKKTTTTKPSTVSPTVINSKTTDYSSTTTLAPNSSTTAVPPITNTSASAPAPVPDPQTGKWWINDTDTIIVLSMAAQLDIKFNDTKQLAIKKIINIPSESSATKVDGTFDKNNETIKISWKASNISGENFVAFHFNKYNQTKMYALASVHVSLDASVLFPELNSTLKLVHSEEHFNITIGHSYRCVKLQNFSLTEPENDTQIVGQLKVTNLQFQAFKDDAKPNFGLPEDCTLDFSDVVPIAVGCILAALVVIVLAAYLISRRRSQARGYYSM